MKLSDKIMKTMLGLVLAIGVGLTTSVAAWAQSANPEANGIEAITVAGQQGGNTVVKITLRQPLANPPAGFTINNPPRIAFDFPNTVNALGKNAQEVGDGDLRNLNIVQAGDRTRLVMNLSKSLGYDTKVDGRTVYITLQSSARDATAAAPITSHFAEAKPDDTRHTLRDISFRRGPNGEGRIIVDLSDNAVGIDLRQQGKNLVIEFQNTSLPKNLERRLDVLDFATPVQTIDAFAQGGNSRIAIEPKGLWEHSAYQTDNRFIVEIKPIVEDPSKLIQGSRVGYTGEKLSLNFQNVEVRAVLQVIADFTGFNFITSDTVGGNLTLRLKDVPRIRRSTSYCRPKVSICAKAATWCGLRRATNWPPRKSLPSNRKPRLPIWSRCARNHSSSITRRRMPFSGWLATRHSRFCPNAAAPCSMRAPIHCSCRTRPAALNRYAP